MQYQKPPYNITLLLTQVRLIFHPPEDYPSESRSLILAEDKLYDAITYLKHKKKKTRWLKKDRIVAWFSSVSVSQYTVEDVIPVLVDAQCAIMCEQR